MPLFPRVKSVQYLGGHKLRITFTNRRSGEVDFKPYLKRGTMIRPLKDPKYFAQVRVDKEIDTIVWPNGMDWCPDVLYWLVTGEPITFSTDPKYHQPPPHLQNLKKGERGKRWGRSQ